MYSMTTESCVLQTTVYTYMSTLNANLYVFVIRSEASNLYDLNLSISIYNLTI